MNKEIPSAALAIIKISETLLAIFYDEMQNLTTYIYIEPTPKSFKEITLDVLKGVDYVVNLHHEKICSKPTSIIKLNNNGIV